MAATLTTRNWEENWVVARDGSVTWRDTDGHWFAGCSVPLLAGRALLRSLVVETGGHCLLAPAHAGLVIAARERVGPEGVIFVIQPDLIACRTILSCCDLSAELATGRVWFAAGAGWSADFHRMFADHPGLAAPARFIQTRLTPNVAMETLIAEAQRVIGTIANDRAATFDRLQRSRRPTVMGRAVVIAGSRFRLWRPNLQSMTEVVREVPGCGVVTYDMDEPLTATPLELARATDGAAAVVAADLARGDAAAVVGPDIHWITWQTRPAIPPAAMIGANDQLIVADPTWQSAAVTAGWPRDRIHVAQSSPTLLPCPTPLSAVIGILADTLSVEIPDAVRSYSSHQILWETIAAELHDEPLVVVDAGTYLTSRAKRFGIDPAELSHNAFIEGLILPSYVQGLARQLLEAKLPVRLWGQGWPEMPEFTDHAAGPVTNASDFDAAVAASTVLIRPVPGAHWHPIDSCGRPVVSVAGATLTNWLAQVTTALRHVPAPPTKTTTATLASTISKLLTLA